MADNFPIFPFTTQEDWYGELSFISAEDGQPLSLEGRVFEMPITPASSGAELVEPKITLTMAAGGGLTLKNGDPSTIVFRVPRTTANALQRMEYTADLLEVVGGNRYLFMPARIQYFEPSALRTFLSRFLGAKVSFSARRQPIITPVAVPGREGRPGATILRGTVPPVPADGKDDDYYIEDRTASGQGRRMYGPKAGGAWPGTPWNIQVAAISDVPGLPKAIEDSAQRAANLSDLADKAAARRNIDLGAAALLGTSDPGKKALEQGDAADLTTTISGAGAVARTLLSRFEENVQLSDFGWDKTGNTDAGPALRAAAAKLGARGGCISIGAGVCWLDSPVEFTRAVEIEGQGYTEGPGTGSPGGTQILISRTGFVPFTFSGVNARGATVRNLAVRQIQPNLTGTTWAPTDYDYVFRVVDTLGIVTFDNILFQGVTRGIYVNNSGRLHIPTLKGQFYVAGVEIDNAYDIPRIGYLHAWPFATGDARVMKWQQDNLDTIILRKVDGIYLGDIFTFSDRSSIYFTSGANGVTTKAYISNLYSDLSRYGIRIDGPGTAFQAANVTTQNNDFNNGATPLSGSAGLLIDTTNVVAQIGNWRTDLVESSAIKVNQTGNRVQMNSLRVNGFNKLANNSPAVSVSAGSTVEIAHPPILADGGTGPVFGGGGSFQRTVGMNVPAGAVNEVRCYASAAGSATSCQAIGSDASIDLLLGSKGPNGSTRIQSNGATVFRTDNPSSGNTSVLMRSGNGSVSSIVESGSASADYNIAAKGSTGSVRLQSNGVTVLRADSPAPGDSSVLVRSGVGGLNFLVESGSANADLGFGAKGAGNITLHSAPRFNANNVTGSASATLGANSPATVPGAPYTWITAKSSDGTTVYIPAWR